MKFEEALTAMRAGAKIWHPGMPEDEYYMVCRIKMHPSIDDPINIWEMDLSIVWMKDGKQHPDMMYRWKPLDPKTDPCRHGMAPMINLLWLMSEGWKILGGVE